METINLGASLTFIVVTSFTPGPNNISSSSMGILYGYRKTINFLLGIMTGFFVIMLLSGAVSHSLYAVLPSLESVMRLVGAAYILWLTYKTVKSSYDFSSNDAAVLGFSNGLLLQVLNPKVWVFGLTLYTTFLAGITGNILLLTLSAIFLTCVAFCATSTWALSGTAISQMLRKPKFQKALNMVLALLLLYTAVSLSGVL